MPNRTIKPSHGNQRFDRPYVIVIALDSLAGLQTARIFHDRGVPVIGIAQNPRHWACKTNACKKIVASRLDSQELVSTLQTIGPELGQRAVLVPCSDISVATVSTNRALLTEWFHIRLPAHRTVATLASKRGFVDFANTHGLPIPQSYIIRNRDDATAAADCIPYPCVIKPTRRSEAWDKGVRAKALKVGSRSEFMSIYEQVHLCTDTLIAQEWIEGTNGDLFSCNCYYDRASRPLVTFVARKIRQWPPIVGISSLGEEVRNDTVLQQALKLFEAANYEGLGYVEIKQDRKDRKYYIIEANIGRPTGRSAIAEAAGVELLYTMYCDAIGHDLPAETQQRYTGVKWIYLRQDLRSAFFYWKHGELSFREWISSLRGRKFFAVLSWRDPIPFLADLWRAMRKEFRKRLRQRAGDVTSRDARHETSLEHNRQVQPRDQN